jgi:predicted nucleic acid-binding protein
MAERYTRPYLDSSVFIAWIKGEVVGRVDRGRIAAHILKQGERREIAVVTSAFTLAEVHKAPGLGSLAEEQDDRLLEFFKHEWLIVKDVTRTVAEAANRICRVHSVKPPDAVHIASAIAAKCDALYAWDDKLTGLSVPGLAIVEPVWNGQMELEGMAGPEPHPE